MGSGLDPLWYKEAIIYQLHVKAFFDSDNDGFGDFRGLIQRLDYIKDLGVTAIWLMPFYPSPQRDDGYDISEYKNVHPDHGTKRDARAFVRKAHGMGLKVITELVINHTSDQHPWFQRARRAPKGSALRNFYVWSDTTKKYGDTPIIFSDTENSNWAWDDVAGQYYWHRFFSHQPDLNLDNPLVFRAVMGVMRFWLDAGVDGLRLDAVPYLIEREGTNNQGLPETHEILKKMRAEMDARYEEKLFLAEANEWPEDLLPYFGEGDECHMAFHFPLMPRVYMAIAQEDRHPIVDIVHQTPEIPDTCQWAIFLRNHDELTLEMVTDRERDYMYQTYGNDPRMRVNVGIRRRLAPMMENDRPRIELLNSLLMSMPGTPIVYYGDEIGMGDNIFLGDRDAVRTPMQWTSDRNAGFSRAEPARLYLPPIMDPVYGYESVNVEAQGRSAGSLLSWMKRIIAVRKAHKAFGRGTMEFLHPGNRKVLAYLREHEDEAILCVANLSRSAQPVELGLSRFRGRVPVELLGGSSFPTVGDLPYMVTLPGHGFYWFHLAKDAEPPVWHRERPRLIEPPVLVLPAGRTHHLGDGHRAPLYLPARQLTRLEQEALPNFLGAQRWFAADEDDARRTEIATQTGFGSDRLLALLRVHAREGLPEVSETQLYFLPLSAAWEAADGEDGVSALMPHAVAKLRQRARMGLLYDALADEGFCREVVAAIGEGRNLEMGEGRLVFSRTDAFGKFLGEDTAGSISVRRAEDQANNSLAILGERLVLKAYRRLQRCPNADLEIGRYLTEEVRFGGTPPLTGIVEYETSDGEIITLALLQGFVENQGDGWSYTRDLLTRYFEDRLVASWSIEDQERAQEAEEQAAEEAFFADLMRTLGLRTGELHAAFAAPTDDEAFSPESAPPEEVAGWAEKVGEQLGRTLGLLQKRREDLPEEVRPAADRLVALRDEARGRARRVAEGGFGAVKTRYHGDYRLGQVLVVGNDFQIVGFEGDPARPLAERRRKHSPLRDVSEMLLSLDHVVRHALSNLGADRAERPETLESLAQIWWGRARGCFLKGYAEGAGSAASYPEEDEHMRALVDLFMLEGSLQEIHRDLENRPDRSGHPIRRLIQILEAETGEGRA